MRNANVRGLSVRRLEVFKAVVESAQFSAAAAALHVTQPSITAHMKALEKQVGRPLFVRGPGRTKRLTDVGKIVYGYAVDAVRRADEANTSLDHLDSSKPSRFVLGVQRSLAREPFIKCLVPFMEGYPECKLIMHSGTNDEVLGMMRAHAIDAAIFFSFGPVADFESEVIGNERLVFVAAPSHPLARAKQVSPRELAEYGFVTGLAEAHATKLHEAVMRRMGVLHYQIKMEAEEPDAVIDLARYGFGIACSFQSRVDEHLKRGSLVTLRIKAQPVWLDVRWASPSQQALPQIATALIRNLKTSHVFGDESSRAS